MPANLALEQRQKLYDARGSVRLSAHFKNSYSLRLGSSISLKRALITRNLLNLVEKHFRFSYVRLPKIYPKEIVKWPALKSVIPKKLSASELDYVFQNLNTIDLSEKCIKRLNASLKSKSELLTDKVRQHILGMLNDISKKQKNLRVEWSKIKSDSFTWWPAGIKFTDPMGLSTDNLRHILENKDKIKFTDKFKAEYLKYIDLIVSSSLINK